MRWTEVTEEGFRGGPVMPDDYDGSPQSVEQLQAEHRALRHRRQPGRQRLQVEHDLRAAARQGARHRQAHRLPRAVAACSRRRSAPSTSSRKRRAGAARTPQIRVHVIGFAKLVGDLIDGLVKVMAFFGVAALIATAIIYALHALRAQHRAGGRLLAGRRGLAARARRAARLRARPVLDPRAVPRLRDRRVARRAEDERHHAGHRPRHAQAGRRALHVPPPVPGRASPRCWPTRSASPC